MLHPSTFTLFFIDTVKQIIDSAQEEFDGVETFCSERYGAWDVENWCEEREIKFEPVFPTYDRQRLAFKEVLMSVKEGRLKCPALKLPGAKGEDILAEEMGAFLHDSDTKWFGSPEKKEMHGIQDDTMFSLGWTLFGGRMLGVEDFRARKTFASFGHMFQNTEDLLGAY